MQYFDTEKYILDFYEICGRESEGVIYLPDFKRWITNQAERVGGYWRVLLSTNEVINLAFEYSCLHLSRSTVMGKKVVDITHFRTLLIQLFVVSVLWSLFRKADSNILDAENPDAFNNELDYEEFAFAMRTFCVCYSQNEPSDDDIRADFDLFDERRTGHVQFATVCRYCSKFMQSDFCQQFAAAKTREQRVILLTDKLYGPKLSLQNPDRLERVKYTMEEAPIELIIDLQSRPSDEEREYLPALALSSSDTPNDDFDDNSLLLSSSSTDYDGVSTLKKRSYSSTTTITAMRNTSTRHAHSTSARDNAFGNSPHRDHRQKSMSLAMACLSAKIEEDLEKADLVSMRMSTWQSITATMQSPKSSKLFTSILSPKSGITTSKF